MTDKARNKAQDKARGDLERRDSTERRRVADRILHKNLHLNKVLLDSLPHPAMLIRKDRMILAANRIARQLGAKVGGYCWRDFGQSEFIPEQDRQYINDHKEVPPGGTCCVFCMADEALDKQTHTHNPEIKAWDKIWDMHWIGLDEETFLHYGVDVTHISREDEKLRMSELKYRSLAQNIPGLAYRMLVKQDNRMLFFNKMLEEMTGFKESELEKGKVCSIEPHILAEDRDKVKEAVRHACDEKEPFEVEYRFKHKNGDIRWFKEIGRPVFGPNDELLFIDGIITDITERKRAEEQLSFMQFAVEHTADPAFWMGPDARFIYVNESACRSLGYTRQELLSMTVHDIDPDFGPEVWPDHWRDIKERGSFTIESHHRTKNGRVFPVEIGVNFLAYGGNECNCAFARDITERKRVMEALKESEEKFRNLAEHSPNMIFINLKGRVAYANDKCEELMGYTKEEFHVPDFDFMSLIAPEFRDLVKANYDAHMRGEEVAPYEYGLVNKKGERIDTILTTKIIRYEGQDAILGTVTDITERKRAEKALKSERDFTETSLNAQEDTFFVFEPTTGKACRWNKAFSEISGYSDDEIRSMKAPDSYYSQDDLKKAAAATQKILKGKTVVIEMSLITKEGKSIPTEYAGSVIKDDQGNPRYIIAIGRDITERKQAEQKLKESEERYKAVLAQSVDPVIIHDLDGNVVMANQEVCKQTGYTQEEILNMNVVSVDDAIIRHDHKTKIWENLRPNEPIMFESSIRRKDGSTFPAEVRLAMITIAQEKFILASARNVTERKRTEKELRDESAFRKAVIERAAEGICVCHAIEEHPHVAFTVWNERMGDITGYTMDEINRLGWYQTMYPDPQLQQKAVEQMERMRQGDDLVAEEWEITRKGGLKRLLAISTSVIVTEGNKSHVLVLMHDITEEKKTRKEREEFLKGLV